MEVNNPFEKKYRDLLVDIYLKGSRQSNRTGVDTFALFNQSIEFDFSGENMHKMPVITGKEIFYDKAVAEFDWMWLGRTDIKYLKDRGVHWWDDYAVNGEVHKSYGYQLRNYGGEFDQIRYVQEQIIKGSRRAHITMWNPCDLNEQALPCCYTGFTFVRIGAFVNMTMEFRSSDVFLGLPYDFIVGALLLKNITTSTNTIPGKIVYQLNNAHVYVNHTNQVLKYINHRIYNLPSVNYMGELEDYEHGPYIKAPLNN